MYKEYLEKFLSSEKNRPYLLLFSLHSCLFITLLVLAFLIFQTDPLTELWYSGTYSIYGNDSWKFIENTLDPVNPPYLYHLVATSLHYLIPYTIGSFVFPSDFALKVSILLIQYLASLLTVFLLYQFLSTCFDLRWNACLVLIVIYDFLFMSPFLILASSEILFLFYQILAWTFFNRKRYFFAAIAASMTFALRFNGAFFIIGLFIAFFLKWWKNKEISLLLIVKVGFTSISMVVIGFISFFQSLLVYNDFWLPLTLQNDKYISFLGTKGNEIVSIPFLWWIDYTIWILHSNSVKETGYFALGVLTFILGIFSVFKLFKWSHQEKLEFQYALAVFFSCGFIGINFLKSVNNYARFQSTIFPIFPAFPLILKERSFSSLSLKLISIGSIIVGISFNVGWWLLYTI